MRAPTGEQFELAAGRVRAVVTEVAAGLRMLTVDGVDVTEPFPEHVVPPSGDGIVLSPWPNRVADARWTLDGEVQQLDITEPERGNALHGLLRHSPYRVLERADGAITLGATVFPQHGYPFLLDTTVRYELTEDGIRVTHGVHNVSDRRAPYAVGTHPFFRIGDVPTEELTLTLHASTRIETDERLNPVAEVPVEGTAYDLRGGRRVGDLALDGAFADVALVDGASAELTAPDGRRVRLLQDPDWDFVQVFTRVDFPKDGGAGFAIAIEPMTAAPNALNSGRGLRWLEPDERWQGGWGVRYSA